MLKLQELVKLTKAGQRIVEHGMTLNAGHGLNYQNVKPIATLDQMVELNIGHSIVAHALMVGDATGGSGDETTTSIDELENRVAPVCDERGEIL